VRPTLFVSDVHLSPARPQIAELFFRFLAQDASAAAALYILGDLFDLWVGDDDPLPLHGAAMDALGRLARGGVELGVMHGNRDFLIRDAFAERTGARLLPDQTLLSLNGTPTLLMHGDTLCTDDLAYQRDRARYRRPWVLRGILALPRPMRVALGRHFREKSERTKRVTAPTIMDVNAAAVETVLRVHGYPTLIHGHTHRPARHVHAVDGHRCERWVLGDWYEHGSYLRWDGNRFASVTLA
jgi:UDP-2,3-diacylglucosamine hydrolase